MENTKEPLFHIKHSPSIRRELYALYKKSATKAIMTKYSILIFFTLLVAILLPTIFTPEATAQATVANYVGSLVTISIVTLVTTFLTVIFSQVGLFVMGKFLLGTELVFSFFQDFFVIKKSNNKKKAIQYHQLEYIQEKDGFDFFYPHSGGLNKIFAISKSQVKEREAYQDFLGKVKNNKFKNRSFLRYLGILVWGLSDRK